MYKPKLPIKIMTLDTETRGMFGEIFRVGLFDGVNYYKANDFKTILKILKKESKMYDLHVYIHNLDFDVSKISPSLFSEAKISFEKSMFINGSIATLSTEFFTLHDSYKILKSSLEKLCKDYHLEEDSKMDLTEYIKQQGYAVYKKNGDYDEEASKGNYFMKVPADDPILNEYLFYDCKSLYRLIEITIELAEIDIDRFIFCPTTASLCMTVYKTRYPEDYEKATKTRYGGEWGKFLEDFIRQAYYGGRTEVFKPYLENGFHYDVNSLYPYVMKMFKFPVGIPEFITGEKAERIYRFWKLTKKGGGFLHCKVFVPDMFIPPLPKHDKSGKLMFPVGNLEGVWGFPEIFEAEKMGCKIIEITQCVYFSRMENIFEAFIKQFEEIKTTSEGAKRTFAKDMQNNLYGKFGMQRVRTTFTDMENLLKVKEESEKNDTPYMIHRHTKNMVDISFIEHVFTSRAEYIQPQIAAYTCLYARIVLLRGLLRQNESGEAAYCDTDSIACTTRMLEEYVHESEYGKFKLEKIIEKAIFLQPKLYAEIGMEMKKGEWVRTETIKAKGIPKRVMKQFDFSTYEKWYSIIREGKQKQIQIYDGEINRQKFLTSLKNDDDLEKQVVLRKSINLMLEQKRFMDYDNNTTAPHVRNDFGEGVESQPDLFAEFKDLLFDYYDDVDIIKDMCKQHGHIKRIREGENFYNTYNKLNDKAKRTYFRNNGVSIINWCEDTGWKVTELLYEMGVVNDN